MGADDWFKFPVPEKEKIEHFDDFDYGLNKVSREKLKTVRPEFKEFETETDERGEILEENTDDYTSAVAMKHTIMAHIFDYPTDVIFTLPDNHIDAELGKCCSRVYQVTTPDAEGGTKTQYGFYAYPESELRMFVDTMSQVERWKSCPVDNSPEGQAIVNECTEIYQKIKNMAESKTQMNSEQVLVDCGIDSRMLPKLDIPTETQLNHVSELCSAFIKKNGIGNAQVNSIADTAERMLLLNGMQNGNGEPKLDTMKGTLQRMSAKFETVGHRLFGNSKEFTALKDKLHEISQKKDPLTVEDFEELTQLAENYENAKGSSHRKTQKGRQRYALAEELKKKTKEITTIYGDYEKREAEMEARGGQIITEKPQLEASKVKVPFANVHNAEMQANENTVGSVAMTQPVRTTAAPKLGSERTSK